MVTWSMDCPSCKVEVLIETVDRSADCDGDNISCANGCSLYYFITADETMALHAYECDRCDTTKGVKAYDYGNLCDDCHDSGILVTMPSNIALSRTAPIGAIVGDEHGNEYRIIDSKWNIEPVDL